MAKVCASEGAVGDGLEDALHCRAAAEHARDRRDECAPTAAEAARIQRGQELIARENEDLR